jgi:hypothetical protein
MRSTGRGRTGCTGWMSKIVKVDDVPRMTESPRRNNLLKHRQLDSHSALLTNADTTKAPRHPGWTEDSNQIYPIEANWEGLGSAHEMNRSLFTGFLSFPFGVSTHICASQRGVQASSPSRRPSLPQCTDVTMRRSVPVSSRVH